MRALLALGISCGLGVAAWASCSEADAGAASDPQAPAAPGSTYAAGAVEPDVFHPDHQPGAPGEGGRRPPLPAPAYGGRATIHLERLPKSLNNVLENEGVVRRMMLELHETLLARDWETLELGPSLATSWTVEDAVHLRPGIASKPPGSYEIGGETIVLGLAQDRADDVVIRPGPSAALDGSTGVLRTLSHESVTRVERGTVITFSLRGNVRWHDGHPFDARDVVFSLDLYKNPLVDCGQRRSQYADVLRVEALDSRTVRVWFGKQSYNALAALGTELTILPSHLYDLTDLDCAEGNARRAKDPKWMPGDAERAEWINKNAHNRDWVGLGPYRLKRFDEQGVLAERNTDYFDPAHGGYLDSIFWRFLADDAAAFQALQNGELDFFARVSADDYFGAATQSETFTKRLYKGYFYSGNYWCTAWNLQRPKLADLRVRRAIAETFDFEAFKRSAYKGLADQVTGPWIPAKAEYDKDVKPFPHDPEHARRLLEEAGWIDRDGDGIVDKDGVALEIELLSDGGNAISKAFAAKLQEDLSKVGIRLRFTPLDSKAIAARKLARDFDGIALGWALTWENDPEQIWHSRWAPAEARGSNFAGYADPESDALIEQGQRELDTAKRAAIWRKLHARIYSQQPYLFCYSPPRKFAINKALRGVQLVLMDPNYVLRRWYYPAGTPGTRATPSLK